MLKPTWPTSGAHNSFKRILTSLRSGFVHRFRIFRDCSGGGSFRDTSGDRYVCNTTWLTSLGNAQAVIRLFSRVFQGIWIDVHRSIYQSQQHGRTKTTINTPLTAPLSLAPRTPTEGKFTHFVRRGGRSSYTRTPLITIHRVMSKLSKRLGERPTNFFTTSSVPSTSVLTARNMANFWMKKVYGNLNINEIR